MKVDNIEEFYLITIYGDEIKITTDEDGYDGVYTRIYNALDTNDIYCVGDYGESARFKDHELNTIDFKKIIGIS